MLKRLARILAQLILPLLIVELEKLLNVDLDGDGSIGD